jgi:eukaryotic-like serine/threonine-protein kinase
MGLVPGTRFGHYEVVASLGAGGSDSVFRARDTALDREVTLTVFTAAPPPIETPPAAGLEHPGIAEVYDTGIENGVVYAASERAVGEPLQEVLRNGALPLHEALNLTEQIAEALAAAHASGIAHGGLDAEHIVVDDRDRVRIHGFGLNTGASPLDDIRGLGTLLHEMLGGGLEWLPPIPPLLRQIAERCLAPDPKRRFQSAADLAFALRAVALTAPEQVAEEGTGPRDWGLAVVALACAAVAVGTWFLKPTTRQPVYDITPLTAFTGAERNPALSPDGERLAFVWTGEPPGAPGVFVKRVRGTAQPQRVSPPDATAAHPVWSPDGSQLAYVRSSAGRVTILAIPAGGGPERAIQQLDGTPGPVDWSPDGNWLAASSRDGSGEALYLISVANGELRKLTTPPPGVRDHTPAFSPDGRTLAFLRLTSAVTVHLCRLRLNTDGTPRGEARTVGRQTWNTQSLDWMGDGTHVVIPLLTSGRLQFWSVAMSNGEARQLPLETATDATVFLGQISIRNGRMAFANDTYQRDIGRLVRNAAGRYEPAPFYSSSRSDDEPQVSPDGKHVVFSSTRSGDREIWRADPDGANAVQLTSLRAVRVGSPRWSPDGRSIVFDGYAQGNFDLWAVPFAGGPTQRLTSESSSEYRPSFSRDGRSIYFGSDRRGVEIWRMPAAGGAAEQMTHDGGFEGFESPDGKWLYYVKGSATPVSRLFRIPVGGGAEEAVSNESARWGWAMDSTHIYLALANPARLGRLNPQTREVEELYRFPEAASRWGTTTSLAVSPDGSTVYHAGTKRNDSDILLVENFR